MDKLLYGDFEEQYTDYETAEIAILPVPYDGTSNLAERRPDKGPPCHTRSFAQHGILRYRNRFGSI